MIRIEPHPGIEHLRIKAAQEQATMQREQIETHLSTDAPSSPSQLDSLDHELEAAAQRYQQMIERIDALLETHRGPVPASVPSPSSPVVGMADERPAHRADRLITSAQALHALAQQLGSRIGELEEILG